MHINSWGSILPFQWCYNFSPTYLKRRNSTSDRTGKKVTYHAVCGTESESSIAYRAEAQIKDDASSNYDSIINFFNGKFLLPAIKRRVAETNMMFLFDTGASKIEMEISLLGQATTLSTWVEDINIFTNHQSLTFAVSKYPKF